jgi:hypothetical protein
MFTAAPGSPAPTQAPAMKGLSSGILAKTTSLAAPKPCWAAVASAICRTVRPISPTASMLIPAFLDATLTEAQTRVVRARTSGSDWITIISVSVIPLWTSAVKPPTRSIPQSAATLSKVSATAPAVRGPWPARRCVTGEIASRLLVTGMPYFAPTRSQVATNAPACDMTFSRNLPQSAPTLVAPQSSTLSARVTARTSRCSACSISMVERISSVLNTVHLLPGA